MKSYQNDSLPVSQRSLAAYLGVSHSLLSMTKSGKAIRSLPTTASAKMSALIHTHLETGKMENGATSRQLQKAMATKGNQLAKKMLKEAERSNAKAVVFQNRLDDIKVKYEENFRWLQTLDIMLGNLPKEKASSGDRSWLEYQRVITMQRLTRNSITVQAEMQLTIEMEKAKAGIYLETNEELLRRIG